VDDEQPRAESRSQGLLHALCRSALVLPLAYGVFVALRGMAWALGEPGQDPSFYLGSAAIWLSPGVAYAIAGALQLRGGRHRTVWLILLVCGVALGVLYLTVPLQLGVEFTDYFDRASFALEPLIPIYLAALAAVHLVRRSVNESAGHSSHDGESQAQP